MHIVLYALSAAVLVVSVTISLVSVRRAHEGLDLDLELAASDGLDTLVGPERRSEQPRGRSSLRTAA